MYVGLNINLCECSAPSGQMWVLHPLDLAVQEMGVPPDVTLVFFKSTLYTIFTAELFLQPLFVFSKHDLVM